MGSNVIKEEVIGRDRLRDDITRRFLDSHDHFSPFSAIAITELAAWEKPHWLSMFTMIKGSKNAFTNYFGCMLLVILMLRRY